MIGHGWLDMAIAAILFVASHSLPARPSLRRRLVGILGEAGYLAVYSLVSLLALGWLIVAAGRAPYVELWAFAPWQLWVPNLAMPLVCLLIAFGVATANPLSFGGGAHQEFDPDKPGIAGITRHPLLWALVLWSASHLPPSGDLAHGLLFGGFGVFALLGMVAMDRRFKRTLGKGEWERLARRTSLVPFAALADGRWRPAGLHIDRGVLVRLFASAALYLALLSAHELVVGVSPLPIWPPQASSGSLRILGQESPRWRPARAAQSPPGRSCG
jgi:uncharacterized membrane protein